MDGAGRGGFVGQTKLDHTLGASIAISILPLDGRLEGLFIWWREGLVGEGERLAEGHHSAVCGTLDSSMALGWPGPGDKQPRLAARVLLQAPWIATS